MRAYTLDRLGIAVREGKIGVGESGRGRKHVAVPLPQQATMESDLRPDGRADLLIECSGPSTSALVLIPDQSGYRGGWRLRDARTDAEWDAGIIPHRCEGNLGTPDPECLACQSKPVDRPHAARVVAEGYSAQGHAGRMGGGPDYLLVLQDGQAVEIVRSGRLYGQPAVIRLECRGGVVALGHPRQVAEERWAAAKLAAALQ